MEKGIGPDEIRRAERASSAHRKKLALILGDDFVAHECILSSALGYVPEIPPLERSSSSSRPMRASGSRRRRRTRISRCSRRPQEPCPECDGWGEVLSGSRAAHGFVTCASARATGG